jgi:tRNA threonylcarbamoyladenosine biosynthesis protein TsaE
MTEDTQTILKKHIGSLGELESEARLFVDSLVEGTYLKSHAQEIPRATLVTLSGELGAGKTTFTQHIAKKLGVKDTVNSPTFVIEKIYDTDAQKFSRLVHIDAYRLQSTEDLRGIGFDELMKSPETLIMFEWPERIEGILEKADVRITLEPLADGTRMITYA